ncbi:geranylgeranyl reductase [Piscinibacter sakaiensis]|uniref:Geranylgeranyl reductase n=1 Tax=Piscinibacter sakaiensis TaxID=1547922 RepID=A0A0K8P7H6_PISS1|nr:geranylgeranyl reductase [Piscinibacter sakaiensis]
MLVVGAGPAGSAAARVLAQAGRDVLLVDQAGFPRDKVCGDALIPDAHRVLERLGLLDRVLAEALRVPAVRMRGPRGGEVAVPGRLAVLPRRRLDALLAGAAVEAGARLATPWRFVGTLEHGSRVVGARLAARDGRPAAVEARWTLLATGARPQALRDAGLAAARGPSGVSMRAYLHHPEALARWPMPSMFWHGALRPGYGWVFPGPGGVFNLGVYVTGRDAAGGARGALPSLHRLFERFVALHPPVRALVDGGRWLGPFKGAPLRCSLRGAEAGRPGLWPIGEAAGSSYLLSGEGIGKALETGLLAAEALLADGAAALALPPPGGAAGAADAAAERRRAAAWAALAPHYRAYERGDLANRQPWLIDVLAWAVRRRPARLDTLAAILDERHVPQARPGPALLARLLLGRR